MRQANLAELQAFAAVAEARSFRGAAALAGVAASALSASVRRLEDRLGVRLLHRTTRSVTPTEAGQRLLARLAPALAEIGAAVDGLGGDLDQPSGTLRLNVPGVVARLILPDLLARFLAAYPLVDVELVAEDGLVDVLGRGFDAGVRFEERLEQDLVAVPLGPRHDRYVCVAAPTYLERRGCPEHPNDLMEHATVRHRFSSGISLAWEFERAGETIKVSPPARVVTNSLEVQRAAVVAGHGIAATFAGFYRDLLDEDAVVEILADWSTPFSGPFLYFAGGRYLPPPLRAFVDFLRVEAKRST